MIPQPLTDSGNRRRHAQVVEHMLRGNSCLQYQLEEALEFFYKELEHAELLLSLALSDLDDIHHITTKIQPSICKNHLTATFN